MTPKMPLILGFDTSTNACRVALVRGDSILGHVEADMLKGQAEHLMPICQSLMADAGTVPGDLSAIGVGTGPGNFTGIRISVAAARGLALGLGIPAIGVNAFDALQYGTSAPCLCAVDARRSETYVQRYDASGLQGIPFVCGYGDLAPDGAALIGHGGRPPAFPTAVAICMVARARLGSPQPRPAPVYLRPADAAPGRDAPPNILS